MSFCIAFVVPLRGDLVRWPCALPLWLLCDVFMRCFCRYSCAVFLWGVLVRCFCTVFLCNAPTSQRWFCAVTKLFWQSWRLHCADWSAWFPSYDCVVWICIVGAACVAVSFCSLQRIDCIISIDTVEPGFWRRRFSWVFSYKFCWGRANAGTRTLTPQQVG